MRPPTRVPPSPASERLCGHRAVLDGVLEVGPAYFDSSRLAIQVGANATPTDEPGDIEVLLRVHTAGVDRGVWHIMAGLPCPIRLAGYGLRGPQDRVRGREVAGRVEAVGNNVTTLKPGKDAYGSAEGSFAEHAVGRADKRLSVSARRAGAQAMRTRRRRGTGDAA